MSCKKTWVALAATTLALMALSFEAQANQIPGTLITGTITSISGTEWIKVDGRSFRIQSGSAAAAALSKLTPGQRVDVQLSGPANTAASAVINVVPHSGQ